MNYTHTFIAVAPDTKAISGGVPPQRAAKQSVAQLEHDLISAHPYRYTQEEIQFLVHVTRLGLSAQELESRRAELWAEFFVKPHACLRTSPLARIYGWGFHFDKDGRVALVAVESPDYRRFLKDKSVKQLNALRNQRERRSRL